MHTEATANHKMQITYYTDPLCCWSWAFEPEWMQLLAALGNQVQYRYVMGGLIPDWKHYHDELFSVSRPAQMGPVWMQAGHMSGRYIYDKIWMEDPPQSSYPACIAVKCAASQSFAAGERYLQYCRQAVMAEGINIARTSALIELAEKLADNTALLDVKQFKKDLFDEKPRAAFRNDLQESRFKNINRFPALIVNAKDQSSILFTGFKPCTQLLQTIQQKFSIDMH